MPFFCFTIQGVFSYIERLRKAPLQQRRQMATMFTVVVVAAIALVWVLSLLLDFAFVGDSGGDSQNPGIEAPY